MKNTTPLWIDTFAPSSYKYRIVWSSFEFQQKTDTVWNYQLKKKKLQTSLHRLFLIHSLLTNSRLWISKLIVIKNNHQEQFESLIWNVWESRQCVILHLYLTKWLESTTINLISSFATFTMCVGRASRIFRGKSSKL